WLVRTARRVPEAPALMTGTRVDSDYARFVRRAAAIGASLRDRHGVDPGDRIGVFMTNRREYLEALYGAWFAGAAAVPVNAKLHPREAAWIVEHAGARLVFVSEDVGAGLGEVLPEGVELIAAGSRAFEAMAAGEPLSAPAAMGADAMAWLFYTSGTTGRPKGVMLTAANLHAMTFSYFVDVDPVEQADAALYAAPMSHGAGLYNFMHVLRGARHVVPPSGGFDASEVLDLAPRLGRVSMFVAPTMVRRLVERAKADGRDGEGLRTVVYGGGPMYLADIVEAVEVMGPRFVQIYGQGESPMTITALAREQVADRAHPRWRERLASVGTAHSCVEVAVTNEAGRAMPPGGTGEIVVRGASVMAGYWQDAAATVEALRDGWLRTGDLGSIDEDGFVTLQDRSKDVIIAGGANVYPREVEEALLEHADVAEAAVVGRRHPDYGEEVVAFVALAPGRRLDGGALDRHCLARIARFKRPRAYFEVEALPKNNYGKVLKTELRRRLAEE
ncbi:MAG TPA: AMP-binding protein, partial [Thermohalobaculum sp.]|nr:AMP-binding protein [Thermohalobaculum sp.]